MGMTVESRFRARRRTAAAWASMNEVLLDSEIGRESDTDQFKFGDGVTAWNDLPYVTGDLSGVVLETALDADQSLSANSDARIATQRATKSYVDQIVAAQDAMVFKGVIDCSGNPNYPAADRGWTYRASVAGKIGGASGVPVEVGDLILCLTDGTLAGNQAAVGSNWSVIQTNIDGALTTASIGSTVQGFSAVLAFLSGASAATAAGVKALLALAKGDVGLGNVDNKSSATIRGELTSANVTDALGFTPPTYSSGIWTPAFGGTSSDPTVTYTRQIGTWFRIGNLVHVFGELVIATTSGGSGLLVIRGLPAVSGFPRYQGVMTAGYAASFVSTIPASGFVPQSQSFINVSADVSGARNTIAVSQLQTDSTIVFHATYNAA